MATVSIFACLQFAILTSWNKINVSLAQVYFAEKQLKELVYVDCDLTLVKTEVYPIVWKQLIFDQRKNKFFYQWRHVRTEPRPSARDFLAELGKKYRVEILSLGHSKFQTRVLTELGMIDMVEKIWGPDNCHQIKAPERFVLIDDMAGESLGISYKMNWLGKRRSLCTIEDWQPTLKRHFIQCHPFAGGINDDQPLTDFLPLIDQLLQEQRDLQQAVTKEQLINPLLAAKSSEGISQD